MSEHSPEPWEVYKNPQQFRTADGTTFDVRQKLGYDEFAIEATVRRIVACINFCREFPTEFMEGHQMHRLDGVHISFDNTAANRELAAIKGVVERLEVE